MPLNLTPRTTGDFVAFLKYNGKAGRWYIRNDIGEEIEVRDLTAIFDLENIKTGWILFAEGTAPDTLWDPDKSHAAQQPSPAHRRGFAVNVFSAQKLGGLREFSSNSNASIISITDLYAEFEKSPERAQGLVPVVTCESVEPIKSKFGTNYQPVLKIVKWVPRPSELPTPSKGNGAAETRSSGHVPPPISPVARPPWEAATEAVDSDQEEF